VFEKDESGTCSRRYCGTAPRRYVGYICRILALLTINRHSAPSDWEDFEPTRPSQHIPGAPLPQISQTTKSPGFIRAFRFLEANKTTASKEDLTYGVREWARERNWRFVRRIQPGRARFQLGELKWVKRPPRQHPRENRTSGDGQDRQQPAVDASPIRHKFGEGKAHPRSHQLELVGPGQGERHAGKAKKEKRKARKEKQMLTADHIQNLPSSPHLQMMLGADPIDPFSNFPIRLNSKSRELCHHCKFKDFCKMSRATSGYRSEPAS
jgi:hypothetical protein